MECSPSSYWIPAITASLLLVMPLGSLPSILVGDLMVNFHLYVQKWIHHYFYKGIDWYSCIIWICFSVPGSIWISSELKGLHDDCEHFEVFPPGHLYSSKTGGLKRWYNPTWFSEAIPSTPYDPLVLRRAFENVRPLRIFTLNLSQTQWAESYKDN